MVYKVALRAKILIHGIEAALFERRDGGEKAPLLVGRVLLEWGVRLHGVWKLLVRCRTRSRRHSGMVLLHVSVLWVRRGATLLAVLLAIVLVERRLRLRRRTRLHPRLLPQVLLR
jgi:hypothetical protein